MVKEEKWVWAVVGPILLGAAWLWIDANGVGSFIGLVCLFGLYVGVMYLLTGDIVGFGSKSSDDEITVIDKDGKPTRYVKKD